MIWVKPWKLLLRKGWKFSIRFSISVSSEWYVQYSHYYSLYYSIFPHHKYWHLYKNPEDSFFCNYCTVLVVCMVVMYPLFPNPLFPFPPLVTPSPLIASCWSMFGPSGLFFFLELCPFFLVWICTPG